MRNEYLNTDSNEKNTHRNCSNLRIKLGKSSNDKITLSLIIKTIKQDEIQLYIFRCFGFKGTKWRPAVNRIVLRQSTGQMSIKKMPSKKPLVAMDVLKLIR